MNKPGYRHQGYREVLGRLPREYLSSRCLHPNLKYTTMIKELLILLKLLFTEKPEDLSEEIKLVVHHLPVRGYFSWCGHIITNEENLEMTLPEWIHENIYLYQAKRHKFWCGYYLSYLWNILVGLLVIWSWEGALKTTKYELEAYANKENGWDYMEKVNPWKYYFTPLQRRLLWKEWDKYKKIFLI